MKNSELLMQTGIDIENATFDLTGEVDSDMFRKVYRAVTLLSDVDYITILLNTYGGDFYEALAIYDFLALSSPPAKIICVGPVMSAGITILQAAEERLAYPNAQLMVHYGEDSNESASDVQHNRKLLSLGKDILEERVNVTRKTLNSWFHKNVYFNADRALEVGLIDRVVGVDDE